MKDAPPSVFYDRNYFEGHTRVSPPYTRDRIYPLAVRTAAFLTRRWVLDRVLDLGCAKGYLVEALREQGVRAAFGVDISRYAVSQCDGAVRGRLVVADVERGLPFRESSFELVTAVDLFEHVRDPLPLLREIGRVLASHGVVYLKICHPRHPNATRDPSHVNVRPLSYWRRIFAWAGFTAERLYETEMTGPAGGWEAVRALVRRVREWAAIGTPADYKFVLRKRVC